MAPHSSTLAWKIPWMEEPGRLQSMGSQSRTWLNDFRFHFSLSCVGEGNGNPLQCSCLENPREGEPGGLLSMRSHRVRHDWSNLAAAAIFGIYPGVELLDHMVVLFLVFWETVIPFPTVDAPIYVLINSVQELSSLHILSNICCFWSFWW